MRPRTLDEIVGQEHLLGPGRLLRRSIEGDAISSMILWGPPGSGKTTLADVIARVTRAHFVRLSAVSAGLADLRKVVEDARKLKQFSGQRTIMFITARRNIAIGWFVKASWKKSGATCQA